MGAAKGALWLGAAKSLLEVGPAGSGGRGQGRRRERAE